MPSLDFLSTLWSLLQEAVGGRTWGCFLFLFLIVARVGTEEGSFGNPIVTD